MAFVALALAPFMWGCSVLSALDFGGVDKEPFEFHFGTDHGVHRAASGTKPGAVDDQGVYKPETPEAEAVFGFPNVSAGLAGEVRPRTALTPTVTLEAFRVKAPYVRWWELQAGAGANLVEVSFTKRLVSVLEVTAGPWFGYDFTRHRKAWGLTMTIIKFRSATGGGRCMGPSKGRRQAERLALD